MPTDKVINGRLARLTKKIKNSDFFQFIQVICPLVSILGVIFAVIFAVSPIIEKIFENDPQYDSKDQNSLLEDKKDNMIDEPKHLSVQITITPISDELQEFLSDLAKRREEK